MAGMLADAEISFYGAGMITPFFDNSVTQETDTAGVKNVLSYGLSSYGYDARLSDQFKLFEPSYGVIIDVKNAKTTLFQEITTNRLVLPPHSYVLGKTVETFNIPPNVLALGIGKSTYARAGLLVNVTPLEPGWKGEVVLELANLTPAPMYLYANEGICQFIFFQGNKQCLKTYAEKGNAKYQNQRGIMLAKV